MLSQNIPDWFIGIVFAFVALLILSIGYLLGVAFKRLLNGQDMMIKNHFEMKNHLNATCGKIDVLTERLANIGLACEERKDHCEAQHARIWIVLDERKSA